jgi:ABC-type lipoprotein release transport system permease subunit
MLAIYGLSVGEVFLIVLVAIVISFLAGLWAGRKAYGKKGKEA